MMYRLRLKLVHMLLGKKVKEATIRCLVQGADIWYECITDPAMQVEEGDRQMVFAVERDVTAISEFWTL